MKMPPSGHVVRFCGAHRPQIPYVDFIFKDLAMRWFNKRKPEDVWNEAIQWPIGDIEAAHRIRDICRSAADSAERVGRLTDGVVSRKKSDGHKNNDASERYQRAARIAMEIALKMSDDLLRDSAVREILRLCLKADDTRTAQILFRAIQTASIRGDVLNEHPALRP
ncbi:hypothetical protein [Bradyrhizobium sp. AZCC 2289]|uniref:hypothetical protein n=1 Tax=Bradyrhizobium sp. AZCC 2289 TaxID=3117026 RepID=UPI002FF2108D